MDAAYGGGAQALVLILSDVHPSVLQQLFVELLQVPGSQLLQLDVSDAGDCVVFNDQLVAVGRGGAHIGFGVELVPGAQPACHSVFIF